MQYFKIQNNTNIICPQFTCLMSIIFYFIYIFIFILVKIYFFVAYVIIYFILSILIYLFVKNGISTKNYKKYSVGLIISLCVSIILTCFKVFVLIILICVDQNYDYELEDDVHLNSVYKFGKYSSYDKRKFLEDLIFLFFIINFFYDWIIYIVLLCYKNKVKNLCSNNNIQNENLINSLIQMNYENTQNLNNNNNFVQTNFNNNQNINSPYFQPYVPNLNEQHNAPPYEQNDAQNPNFNVQNTDNGDFTVTEQNTQK